MARLSVNHFALRIGCYDVYFIPPPARKHGRMHTSGTVMHPPSHAIVFRQHHRGNPKKLCNWGIMYHPLGQHG